MITSQISTIVVVGIIYLINENDNGDRPSLDHNKGRAFKFYLSIAAFEFRVKMPIVISFIGLVFLCGSVTF